MTIVTTVYKDLESKQKEILNISENSHTVTFDNHLFFWEDETATNP